MAKKYTGLNLAQTQPKDTIDFTGLGKGVLKAEEFKYKEKEAKKKEAMDFLKPEATFYPYQQSANKILSDAYEMMQKQDKIDPAEYQKIALEYNERIELGKAFGKEFASVVQGYYNDPEINADAAAKMLRDKYIVDGSIDELYRNSSTVLNGSEIYTQPGGSAALITGVILSNRLKTIGEITTKLVTTGDYKKVPGLAGRAEAEVKTTLMKAASIVDLDANGVPYIKDIKSPLAQTAMDVMLTEDKVLRLVDDALLAKGVNQPTQDQRREELALKLAPYASVDKSDQQTSQTINFSVPTPTSKSGPSTSTNTANWTNDILSGNTDRVNAALNYIKVGEDLNITALPDQQVRIVEKDDSDNEMVVPDNYEWINTKKREAYIKGSEIVSGVSDFGLNPNVTYLKLKLATTSNIKGLQDQMFEEDSDVYIPLNLLSDPALANVIYESGKSIVKADYQEFPGTMPKARYQAPPVKALGGEIDVDTKYSDFKGTETVRDLIGGFSQGGYVSTSIYDLMKKGFADGGSMVVSELYELKTGKPWRTAREEGLTDGSYEQNIKLRQQLVRGDFNDNQTYSSGPIQEATVTAKAPDWLKFKKEFMKENPFDINQYVESRVNQPQTGRAAYERINEQEFRKNVAQQGKKMYENKMYDYIQRRLVETNPQYGRPRGEWLDSFSEKEQGILTRNPRFQPTYITEFKRSLQSAFEQNPNQAFYNIYNSPDFTQKEKKEIIMEHIDNPIVSKLADAAGIFAPLSMGSKVIQSAYRDDTAISSALQGIKNDASMIEDIITDITTFIGPGTAAKFKNLLRVGKVDDAAKVLNQVSSKLPEETMQVIDDFAKEAGTYVNPYRFGDKEEGVQVIDDFAEEAGTYVNPYRFGDKEEGVQVIDDFAEEAIDADKELAMDKVKNITLQREGDAYYQALDNPETYMRLKKLDEEYDLGLENTYRIARESWDNNRTMTGNKKLKISELDPMVEGGSSFDDEIYNKLVDEKNPLKKFNKTVKASDESENLISRDLPVEDYSRVVWHELSHDINKYILESNKKFLDDVLNVFYDNVDDVPESIIEAMFKAPGVSQKDMRFKAMEELEYIKMPTEFWAFLSTNLRQQLIEKGIFKNHLDMLTPEKLNLANKSGVDVLNRFLPFVKDKKQFIDMFNKLTLTTVPLVMKYINEYKDEPNR